MHACMHLKRECTRPAGAQVYHPLTGAQLASSGSQAALEAPIVLLAALGSQCTAMAFADGWVVGDMLQHRGQ